MIHSSPALPWVYDYKHKDPVERVAPRVETLTLHLVAVRRLAGLRRGEAGAVAQEARLARRLVLAEPALRLYACPQRT